MQQNKTSEPCADTHNPPKLCVSADLNNLNKIVELAGAIGPHIHALKLHTDAIAFDINTTMLDIKTQVMRLKALSIKHGFMLVEDRKFCDIGSTVVGQFRGGVFNISSWADVVTVHAIAGSGTVAGLLTVNPHIKILIVFDLTCGGPIDDNYRRKAVEIAGQYPKNVIGFVTRNVDTLRKMLAQADITAKFEVWSPGISLSALTDGLNQTYISPQDAIKRGSNVLIVGRDIYKNSHPAKRVQQYKHILTKAHL